MNNKARTQTLNTLMQGKVSKLSDNPQSAIAKKLQKHLLDMRSGTFEMQRTRFASEEQDPGTTDRDEATHLESSGSMKVRLNKKYRRKKNSLFKS